METMALEKFYDDIALQFGGESISENGTPIEKSGGAPAGAPERTAKTFLENLVKSHPDSIRRNRVEKVFKQAVMHSMKLGTGDVGSLLQTSLGERFPWIRNSETQLLNSMEMAPGERLVIDDYMYRVNERRQPGGRASNINPDNTLPAYRDQVYSERFNTLAFWGDPVSATFVARAQTRQQRNIDVLQQAIEGELHDIRQAVNYDCWNAIEQKVFTGSNVTKLGGLLSRITTNTISLGGGDYDDDALNVANDAISAVIGSGGLRVIFTNNKQVGVVRSIEIDRYGGSNQITYSAWVQAQMAKFGEAQVMGDRVFEPRVGQPIMVIHEKDLPSGPSSSVMMSMDPGYTPKFVYFLIGDEPGPWLWVRPVFELREAVMIMHGGTLDDPAQDTRYLFTNHA